MGTKTIGTKEALELAAAEGINVTLTTLISWCEKFSLGRQVAGKGGKWFIYEKEFIDFIKTGGKENGADKASGKTNKKA